MEDSHDFILLDSMLKHERLAEHKNAINNFLQDFWELAWGQNEKPCPIQYSRHELIQCGSTKPCYKVWLETNPAVSTESTRLDLFKEWCWVLFDNLTTADGDALLKQLTNVGVLGFEPRIASDFGYAWVTAFIRKLVIRKSTGVLERFITYLKSAVISRTRDLLSRKITGFRAGGPIWIELIGFAFTSSPMQDSTTPDQNKIRQGEKIRVSGMAGVIAFACGGASVLSIRAGSPCVAIGLPVLALFGLIAAQYFHVQNEAGLLDSAEKQLKVVNMHATSFMHTLDCFETVVDELTCGIDQKVLRSSSAETQSNALHLEMDRAIRHKLLAVTFDAIKQVQDVVNCVKPLRETYIKLYDSEFLRICTAATLCSTSIIFVFDIVGLLKKDLNLWHPGRLLWGSLENRARDKYLSTVCEYMSESTKAIGQTLNNIAIITCLPEMNPHVSTMQNEPPALDLEIFKTNILKHIQIPSSAFGSDDQRWLAVIEYQKQLIQLHRQKFELNLSILREENLKGR